MIRTGTYRYVTWDRVEEFIKRGWSAAAPASEYSCFMFACEDCNPEGSMHIVCTCGRDLSGRPA